MKRCLMMLFLCVFCFAFSGVLAEELASYPPAQYAFSRKRMLTYESDTLHYTIEKFQMHEIDCFLTKVWVADPARQIRKATAGWQENIQHASEIALQIPDAALYINGSGYVSPAYPGIPDNYPGTSEDYYYTPLGSLTITDGVVFRNLEGVPYSGLTLEADGLHMYKGAENEAVLAHNPIQTWSFYPDCPLMENNKSLLPSKGWRFADNGYKRTVIARTNANNYLILTVTSIGGSGLSLHQVNRFFRNHFKAEWVYNLDGGPSSVLVGKNKKTGESKTFLKGGQKIADILAFTE